jgi:hypothetical protein
MEAKSRLAIHASDSAHIKRQKAVALVPLKFNALGEGSRFSIMAAASLQHQQAQYQRNNHQYRRELLPKIFFLEQTPQDQQKHQANDAPIH